MPSEPSRLGASEETYSKAVKAELESDWDQAYRLYIKTAESYLYLIRTTNDQGLRARCQANAGKALDRAEKIRTKRKDLTPVVVDSFSVEEQFYILKKSSTVNNIRFLLWDEPVTNSRSASAFEDPDGQPQLSPEQCKASSAWRRPIEVIPQASIGSPILPDDIIQQIVTDCSVCASISVCLEHHRRFGSQLGLSSTYPQGANGIPCLSVEGRYDFRFFFNGAYHRIAIDDQLPFLHDGSFMCMSTRSRNQLWPSLVEKAYMKLMGGYDFPGSNSGIDIYVLTGWIPEHIEIKSSSFEREKTWTRIASGFPEGRCVLTIGTGERTDVKWNDIDLPKSHCYAVIDVAETNEDRQITLIDSRCAPSLETDNDSSRRQRIIRVFWHDVCNIFDSIYLNWDPRQFKHKLDFHGMWLLNTAGEEDRQESCRHLQLVLQQPTDDDDSLDVWVLLTRHVKETRRKSEYIALRLRTDDSSMNPSDVNMIASKGNYTNSSHVLGRIQVPRSCSVLSIFASYDGDFEDVGFTITAYSSSTMSWNKSLPKALYATKAKGTLTSKNAGGNCSHPTFMVNPQYHLRIHPEKQKQASPSGLSPGSNANVVIFAQASKSIPLHLTVVWSQGERIVTLVRNDVAANSGAYSYGFARLAADLPVGDYTVIVSAFEPRHTGSFSVNVESSHCFDFKAILQEGAGMYSKTVRGAWDENTAMGSPTFKRYLSNPIFEIGVTSPMEIKIRLQLMQPCAVTPLNVTLYPPSQDGLLGEPVVTSGPYADSISGVATPQVPMKPGNYLLVPSTYNPGVHAAFRLIIYSTRSGVDIVRKSGSDYNAPEGC